MQFIIILLLASFGYLFGQLLYILVTGYESLNQCDYNDEKIPRSKFHTLFNRLPSLLLQSLRALHTNYKNNTDPETGGKISARLRKMFDLPIDILCQMDLLNNTISKHEIVDALDNPNTIILNDSELHIREKKSTTMMIHAMSYSEFEEVLGRSAELLTMKMPDIQTIGKKINILSSLYEALVYTLLQEKKHIYTIEPQDNVYTSQKNSIILYSPNTFGYTLEQTVCQNIGPDLRWDKGENAFESTLGKVITQIDINDILYEPEFEAICGDYLEWLWIKQKSKSRAIVNNANQWEQFMHDYYRWDSISKPLSVVDGYVATEYIMKSIKCQILYDMSMSKIKVSSLWEESPSTAFKQFLIMCREKGII